MINRYSITSVAVTPEGAELDPVITLFNDRDNKSISEIALSLESRPFTMDYEGKKTPFTWAVKSITKLDNEADLVNISARGLAELYVRADSINEKHQIFAGEVYRYLEEYVSCIENEQLSMDVLLLNLKDLLELADKNFDKEAAKIEALNHSTVADRDWALKETWEHLDGLIDDIDSGKIKLPQIKDRLEHIKFFSEV